jgi:spore germination cell wall hydrolase CwlJ-like protein
MLKKLLAVFAAGMLSFSSPLNAASMMPGSLPVVSETTIPVPAQQLMQPAVQIEQLAPEPDPAPVVEEEEVQQPVDDTQALCVARAMYYEAKGESLTGKKAVGYVVLNRVKAGKWRSTPCGVISQPHQFSWYSPSKRIPTKVKSYYLELAQNLMASYSNANDPTGGATFFHAKYVHPGWKNVRRLLAIGGHIFYRLA